MRKVEFNQLVEGMILGAPIVDAEGIVELLSAGTRLTHRHIALINRIGILDIFVLDDENEIIKANALNLQKIIHNADDGFDMDKLLKDLEEIENQIYEPA